MAPQSTNGFGFTPRGWQDIVGNAECVQMFQTILRRVLATGNDTSRILVSGRSRSGKTAMIELLIKALLCLNLNQGRYDPCGRCGMCRGSDSTFGHRGLEVYARNEKNVHFLPLDPLEIGGAREFRAQLAELHGYSGLRVVVVDEAAQLARYQLDEHLLTIVDRMRFLWILASADADKLQPMLLKRLVRVRTASPTVGDLVTWLKARCEERQVSCEREGLVRLAERSDCIPGLALQAIEAASLQAIERLDAEYADNFAFSSEVEW